MVSAPPERRCPAGWRVVVNVVHRLCVSILVGVLVIGSSLVATPSRVIALSGDKKPNLQMTRLHDWHIQWVNGRRLLRFTTVFVNVGHGRFELKGHRASTSDPTMSIDQIMYRTDGTKRRLHTDAIARYAGDGHDHWHVQNVVIYEAWRIGDLATTRRGAKTGFCFFDTTPWKLGLRGAPQHGYYQEEWCGTKSVLHNRVGVSVGWGDNYPWNFVFQWIDITGLRGGRYRVRATVDLQNDYDEMIEDDNCTWAIIDFPDPRDGRDVTVEKQGMGCDEDAMQPVTTYAGAQAYEPPQSIIFEPAVHVGYKLNSRGTELDRAWHHPTAPRTGSASVRATVPGRPGHWFYVVSGPYAGYWFRDTAEVDLAP
jgi:Lysyl oxidase